MKIFFVLTFPS